MSEETGRSEIIERIYDVAVDPARYEALLDVWERRLSTLRTGPEATVTGRVAIDSEIETHLERAGVFLERLSDEKGVDRRSPLDLDLKASFLVDDGLRVARANRAANEVLKIRDGDPLDRLPLCPEDRDVLKGAVRRTAAPKARDARLLRFTSAASGRPIVFHVTRQAPPAGDGSLVLVRTTEVGWPEHLSRSLREAFLLTPAEVEIARALAEGNSMREIAAGSGRSIETVKTHLSAVLAKTGTRSQAELIRITLGLMDVVGATAPPETVAGAPEDLDPIPFRSLTTPDGRRYDWIEFGDPAGRPCLFLPMDYGLIRWPRSAEVAAGRLRIRVIVPVRAGYGHSSPLPRDTRRYVEATGADLLELLDHLKIRRCAVLPIGSDLRFALALAAIAPGRVTGIIGCSTALPIVTPQQYERMGKWHRFILANARYAPQILPFLVKAGFALARRVGKDHFFRAVQAGSPGDLRTFADPEIRQAILLGSDICLGPRHSAHDAFARECIDSEEDWTDLIRACSVPVRLLQGSEDQQTPAETVQELMVEFPKLNIEIVEGAGTLLFFQMWPRVLADLEGWLV